MAKIVHGVAPDGEADACFAMLAAVEYRIGKQRSIQQRAERSDPRLIVVARAKKGKDRIGEMTLHHGRDPILCVVHQPSETALRLRHGGDLKDADSARRRSCTRGERDDERFASLERSENCEKVRRRNCDDAEAGRSRAERDELG